MRLPISITSIILAAVLFHGVMAADRRGRSKETSSPDYGTNYKVQQGAKAAGKTLAYSSAVAYSAVAAAASAASGSSGAHQEFMEDLSHSIDGVKKGAQEAAYYGRLLTRKESLKKKE